MSPVAVFVGAPGSGKTTIGKRVASVLGVPFVDTDHLIEERAGTSISDIFLNQGEPAFRAMEADVIGQALHDVDGVLSLGGGAVLNAQTRERLAGHRVVWLRVSLADAARRVGMNTARPLLLGNVRAQLGELLEARTPLYTEVSTIVVDTSHRPVRMIVDEILGQLRSEEGTA